MLTIFIIRRERRYTEAPFLNNDKKKEYKILVLIKRLNSTKQHNLNINYTLSLVFLLRKSVLGLLDLFSFKYPASFSWSYTESISTPSSDTLCGSRRPPLAHSAVTQVCLRVAW